RIDKRHVLNYFAVDKAHEVSDAVADDAVVAGVLGRLTAQHCCPVALHGDGFGDKAESPQHLRDLPLDHVDHFRLAAVRAAKWQEVYWPADSPLHVAVQKFFNLIGITLGVDRVERFDNGSR